MRKKALHFFIVLLVLIGNLTNGQDFNWGKISDEEAEMTEVAFEPSASAVKLKEIGELIITDDGYVLNKYERIKILSIEGFEYAQKKWRYYTDDPHNKVILEDAQTINIIDGKTVVTKLEKKDIIFSLNNDIEEIAFAFPNVRVGAIIEYKVKLIRPQNLYASPWRFQNEIPTISSKLNLKFATFSNYKIILQGKLLNKKYKGKNIKKWELNDVPSDKIFKNVYNTDDYIERIMLQYSSAQRYYGSYYSENSWKGFKKLILKDVEKSIKYADFKQIGNKIKDGATKLETLQNCLQYLQEYYQWNDFLAVNTSNLQSNFLQKKKGNAADFNIFLKEILRTKNIQSELAINSLRSNGRIIIAYPAFEKLETLVNIVEIDDGEKLMIDAATSTPKNIKYLPLDYFNYIILGLENKGEVFTTVSPRLSEFVSQQYLTINKENSTLQIRNRLLGYFNSKSFNQQAFNVFSGNKSAESSSSENGDWKNIKRTIDFDNPSNGLFIIENPFSQLVRQLTVEKDRNYPIELEFPYLATIQLKTKLSPEQKMNTDDFNQKISAFNENLQYVQQIENVDGEEVITWSLLIKQCIFKKDEIEAYNQFVEQLKDITSKAAIIKNK